MSKTTTGYDRICRVIHEIQDKVWNQQESCNLGDLMFEYLTDYKYYGYAIDGHLISLNFNGSSDWCYILVIPDSELNTFMDIADTYPVYFADFDCGEIQLQAKNYKQLMSQWFENHPAVIELSDDTQLQSMPKMTLLDDHTIDYFRNHPPPAKTMGHQ